MMHRFPFAALTCAALAVVPLGAGAAWAQTAEGAAPAEGQAAEVPQAYLAATHGDWQVICQPLDPELETCEMYQLLIDEQQQPTAEISIAALPFGAEFVAGGTVTTPLETFLPTGLGFRIGDDENIRLEQYRVCTVVGCVVRMGFSGEEVDRMKSGSSASFIITPFVAVDQPVSVTMSLSGFTAAFDDVQTRFAQAAAVMRTRQSQ